MLTLYQGKDKIEKLKEVYLFKHYFVFILIVALVGGLLGCSSYQTTEAEQLLKEALTHYQKSLRHLDSFSQKSQISGSDPYSFQDNLKKALVELDKAGSELEVAAKNFERIKELKVEDWRVKHAELLIKSIEKEKEVIKYARNFAEGLQVVVNSVNLLESSAKKIKTGQDYLNQGSKSISKKKWTEADNKIRQAKKHFENALTGVRQLKNSGLEGINEYENFIRLMIKMANHFNQLNQALKNSQNSKAKKVLKQIDATSKVLEKINLKGLSAEEVINSLYQQFSEKLNQLEAEAESFRNSADKLYQENTE